MDYDLEDALERLQRLESTLREVADTLRLQAGVISYNVAVYKVNHETRLASGEDLVSSISAAFAQARVAVAEASYDIHRYKRVFDAPWNAAMEECKED